MNNFKHFLEKTGEIGVVKEVRSSVISIDGLPGAKLGERIVLESGQTGQVLALEEDKLEALLFDGQPVRVGEQAARTGEVVKIPVGRELLGQVVNPLGEVLLPNGPFHKPRIFQPVEKPPLGIKERVGIDEFLPTGVAMVDLLVPLGKGQRELVIGDRKTGKTSFLLQTLVCAVKQGIVGVYALIGKKEVEVKKIVDFLKEQKVFSKTVVLSASASDGAGLVWLAPYSAVSLGEYFRDLGEDVLIILDDMSLHAKYCRELSLQTKRFPGRDSYPVDIFFSHARLVERGGNFRLKDGRRASVTILPVAETIASDLSGYIQTNLMSMTDGHIFFDPDLFAAGKRPAINTFLSVTRVGRQTQTPLLRSLSQNLISFLTEVEKKQSLAHFGGEINQEVEETLLKGELIQAFFQQKWGMIIPVNVQIYFLSLIWLGRFSGLKSEEIGEKLEEAVRKYQENKEYRMEIDRTVEKSKNWEEFLKNVDTKAN